MTEDVKYEEMGKLNPFLSIWLSTRKTVRYVLDHKDLRYSLILAAIAGIPNAIAAGNEWSKNFEVPLWLLLLSVFVLGPILGLVGLGFGTVIYTWVGKWFGGIGTIKEMAQTMGVLMIPSIWLTPYWVLTFSFVRNDLFVMDIVSGVSTGAVVWFFVSWLVTMIYSIWMIVIQSKAIGEVHQFSTWRGFTTFIIPSVVLGILVFVITFFIVLWTFTY